MDHGERQAIPAMLRKLFWGAEGQLRVSFLFPSSSMLSMFSLVGPAVVPHTVEAHQLLQGRPLLRTAQYVLATLCPQVKYS